MHECFLLLILHYTQNELYITTNNYLYIKADSISPPKNGCNVRVITVITRRKWLYRVSQKPTHLDLVTWHHMIFSYENSLSHELTRTMSEMSWNFNKKFCRRVLDKFDRPVCNLVMVNFMEIMIAFKTSRGSYSPNFNFLRLNLNFFWREWYTFFVFLHKLIWFIVV